MTLQLPADLRHGPVCGVLAVAMAAKVSFDTAWETLKKTAGHTGRWKGRTYLKHRVDALARMGVDFEDATPRSRMTLKTFIERHAQRDVTYKVTVTGHVVTVRNNAVADQDGIKNILLHKSCRQRVRNVLIIKEN